MKLRNEGFSVYTIIILIALVALVFVLALPNFFDLTSKENRNQCIKNMKKLYNATEAYMLQREEGFEGKAIDLKRTGFLKETFECPSGKVGDKYFIKGVFAEGNIQAINIRCANEKDGDLADHKLPESFYKFPTTYEVADTTFAE